MELNLFDCCTSTFFVRNVQNSADLNRVVKCAAVASICYSQNDWNFRMLLSECFNHIAVFMSCRGILISFMNMHIHSEHTF